MSQCILNKKEKGSSLVRIDYDIEDKNTYKEVVLSSTITKGSNLTNLSIGRKEHTSSTFGDGGIGVFGGYSRDSFLTSVEYYANSTHTKSILTNMNGIRYLTTSSMFGDGGIGVFGGLSSSSGTSYVQTADYYATSTHTLSTLTNMSSTRCYHSVSTFGDGGIGVFGGNNGSVLSSVDYYANSTHTKSTLTNLSNARYSNISSTFGDGGISVFGGFVNKSSSFTSSVDYYADTTHTKSTLTNMSSARTWASSSTFGDGGVGVFGGWNTSSSLASVDYYANSTHTMSKLTNMSSPRHRKTSSTFKNGGVGLFGGSVGTSSYTSVVDYYANSTHTQSTLTSLTTARCYHSVSTFGDGGIGVFGGDNYLSSAEYYAYVEKKENQIDTEVNENLTVSLGSKYKFEEHTEEQVADSNTISVKTPNKGYITFNNIADIQYNVTNTTEIPICKGTLHKKDSGKWEVLESNTISLESGKHTIKYPAIDKIML